VVQGQADAEVKAEVEFAVLLFFVAVVVVVVVVAAFST